MSKNSESWSAFSMNKELVEQVIVKVNNKDLYLYQKKDRSYHIICRINNNNPEFCPPVTLSLSIRDSNKNLYYSSELISNRTYDQLEGKDVIYLTITPLFINILNKIGSDDFILSIREGRSNLANFGDLSKMSTVDFSYITTLPRLSIVESITLDGADDRLMLLLSGKLEC